MSSLGIVIIPQLFFSRQTSSSSCQLLCPAHTDVHMSMPAVAVVVRYYPSWVYIQHMHEQRLHTMRTHTDSICCLARKQAHMYKKQSCTTHIVRNHHHHRFERYKRQEQDEMKVKEKTTDFSKLLQNSNPKKSS
eukprot:GHVS01034856.1.p1 GENE.GHVS01034856.1~~GHVS01034856.1.p1  ORF type:complete len:134 (-),score=24.42 GHVS01034856.1:1184-1585(-)